MTWFPREYDSDRTLHLYKFFWYHCIKCLSIWYKYSFNSLTFGHLRNLVIMQWHWLYTDWFLVGIGATTFGIKTEKKLLSTISSQYKHERPSGIIICNWWHWLRFLIIWISIVHCYDQISTAQCHDQISMSDPPIQLRSMSLSTLQPMWHIFLLSLTHQRLWRINSMS